MIAIRVNASRSFGLGHLARCRRLAVVLRKCNLQVHFVVDKENSFFDEYLAPFNYEGLYRQDEEFVSEENDAERFVERLQGRHLDAVVVDDYRLSERWEKKCPEHWLLIVLDDRDVVRHRCGMIVDGKWTGESTYKRYERKVSDSCVRLLGPSYLLLDRPSVEMGSTYSGGGGTSGTTKILVNLGGGSDLAVASKLINHILARASLQQEFLIQPVVGYFGDNKDSIMALAKMDARVVPIIHERSLLRHIQSADLYVGATGGTLYEVLLANVPAITFSISENQLNNLNDLADLGHYLHLNACAAAAFPRLAELIWLVLEDRERLCRLYSYRRAVEIDGLGVDRVAKAIAGLIAGEPITFLDQESNDAGEEGGGDYILVPVDDRHINKYLDARNWDRNLKNMTDTKKIDRLDHYLWWFRSERISYQLQRGSEALLYIWHQLRTIDGTTVLVGGWFVCSDNCGSIDALYGLSQQLAITDKEYPGVPWVAVIKKTNQFVRSLNHRLGFSEMPEAHSLYGVVQQCFPLASEELFCYYYRRA